MAQYRIADPEELMECPYDKVHMVRAKRFQYHLIKCRQNYKGKEFVSCPFNAKHEMPKPELRHHVVTCPDKAMMEPEHRYNARKENGDTNIFKGCTDTPVYQDLAIPSNEDWDSEASENVGVGPLHDRSYFSRVQFHDTTSMNKVQRKIMTDHRLTPEQKMAELSYTKGKKAQHVVEDEDNLRLPKTASMAAMPRQPQPKQQPTSSVFAYSIGRGRGLSQQPQTNGHTETFSPSMPYGRGVAPPSGAMGVGRGMAPGGLGRGSGVAPPPGFCVPKVSKE